MDVTRVSWKTFVLATLIVSSGIYIVSVNDSKAGWLLTFIIIFGAAFANPSFGSELMAMLNGSNN